MLLANHLHDYDLSVIVTSPEPKAAETASVIAQENQLRIEYADGLREHSLLNVPFFPDEADLDEKIQLYFNTPDQLVFSDETADEAHTRFTQAISNVIDDHPEGDLVVVTHGTVMTLYLSRIAGLSPYTFWKELGTPSFAVVSLPTMELQKIDTPM